VAKLHCGLIQPGYVVFVPLAIRHL